MRVRGQEAVLCYNRRFIFPSNTNLQVEFPRLKRVFTGIILIVLSAFGLMSCGGGSPSSATLGATSGLTFRAFVSNNFTSQLNIVDATMDALSASTISVGLQPGLMAVTPDRTITLVFDQGSHSFSVVDNATEQQTATISIPAFTESFVVSSDSTRLFAAVPQEGVFAQPNGAVEVLNIGGQFRITSIAVPGAHYLSMSNNGGKLLAFGDNSNTVTVIDTTKINAAGETTAVAGFDRPVAAVFSSDDSQAFVLNCGPECGGTAAGVSVLDMSTLTITRTVPVQAATVGILNGSTLIVAGTRAGQQGQGVLQTMDTGTFAVSGPVAIGDGFHNRMALINTLLFIGARTCNNVTQGCLSIYDTGANTARIDAPNGDVTGMEPITRNRNVLYVVEGGEVRIFNTTTGQLAPTQFDIVGKAIDVKLVDQ